MPARPKGEEPPTRRGEYKFTEEKRTRYLELLRQGARRMAAARAVGMNGGYVKEYKDRFPDFKQACDEAEMEADEQVERALYETAIEERDVKAQQTWLYNRLPERWMDRQQLTAKIEADIKHDAHDSLREKLDGLREALTGDNDSDS